MTAGRLLLRAGHRLSGLAACSGLAVQVTTSETVRPKEGGLAVLAAFEAVSGLRGLFTATSH